MTTAGTGAMPAFSPHRVRRQVVRAWMAQEKFTPHATGAIVLGPPAVGKTRFVRHGGAGDWVDADWFFDGFLQLHPDGWDAQPHTVCERRDHYLECDNYLRAMRDNGLWVVTSLYWEVVPDAAVIPDVATHKARAAKRDDLAWPAVQAIRNGIYAHCRKHGVPIYSDMSELAVATHE